MKVPVILILILNTLNCLSQDPRITFGGLSGSSVKKEQLLINAGIIFSNDTSNNIECLRAVDFSFAIIKLNGDTLEIRTNNCPESVNERKYARANKRFDQGKSSRFFNKISKCNGLNKFNSKQLKAIKKMKSGESLIIDLVKTAASDCSCLARYWNAGLKYTLL